MIFILCTIVAASFSRPSITADFKLRPLNSSTSYLPHYPALSDRMASSTEKAFAVPMKDLTIENITENVHIINSQCPDRRFKYLIGRLVEHLHDLVRETRLSTNEWMAAIHFLTSVGQICSPVRQVHKSSIFLLHFKESQEAILLSRGYRGFG